MATAEITLAVKGMTCGGCAETIRHALEHKAGVSEAWVSWKTGEARVVYDPDRTDETAILGDGAVRFEYPIERTVASACC